ncbi:MAG: methyl-accepting chemotaxis protein [Methylocystaceae bacterium]|nr:methyl-accepting chemotaxis protein [Methylocystaceae bacterium]
MFLGNLKLSTKLGAIITLSLASLVITTTLNLFALDENLITERKEQAKSVVDATYHVLENLQKKIEDGEISKVDAQNQAIEIITASRFGKGGYLWANDLTPTMIAHPYLPDLVGKNLSSFKSADGHFIFKEMVQLVEDKGEGFLKYDHKPTPESQVKKKISYAHLFKPWGWVIGSGINLDEVQSTFKHEAWKQAEIFIIVTLLLSLSAYFVVRDIRGSVKTLSDTMHTLSSGDIKTETPLQNRKDEMGDMAHSVEYFRKQLIENKKLAEQQKKIEETQKERAALIEKLAAEFDLGVNTVLESVASAARQLDMTANEMSATADQTSTQATAVASASQQTSSNVQTVAAAAEELAASIVEVSNQVVISTNVAKKASDKVSDTQTTVNSLSETAHQISAATKLIDEIAEQTNMLALNATIEAARAGEMGKGFAVVASEVKALATQTSLATQTIATHVDAIQTVSQATVQAINEINTVINEMNQISDSVAAAVEEQSAATQEITRNIEQAAKGTEEVTTNISDVKHAANDTGKSSREVLDASNQLSDQSTSLRSVVESFLINVKSA